MRDSRADHTLQTRAAVAEPPPSGNRRIPRPRLLLIAKVTERPWPGDFRSILRENGFRDGVVSHFKRPVPCDPVDWLRTFGKVYLDGVENQENFLEAYRAACSRRLPDGEID